MDRWSARTDAAPRRRLDPDDAAASEQRNVTVRVDPAGDQTGRLVVEVERPADFDAFWSANVAELEEVPADARMAPMPERSTPEVDVYEAVYRSADGLDIAGWYCVPRAEYLPPPYPGLLLTPGYVSEPTLPKSWARLGYAAFGVAPRGKLRSNARFNPGYPGLLVHNIVDRATYGYRGFYLDALRAVDVLAARPEVDRRRIGVNGSSQGGALAVVLAALAPDRIRCAVSGAPYLCAFLDSARLTHSYPYEEINEYLRAHPDHEPLVAETVAYYDVVNFAPLVRCPTFLYVGLEDDVCPPESGFALHRALSSPKQLVTTEGAAHDAGSYWVNARVEAFLAEHLAPAASGVRS